MKAAVVVRRRRSRLVALDEAMDRWIVGRLDERSGRIGDARLTVCFAGPPREDLLPAFAGLRALVELEATSIEARE